MPESAHARRGSRRFDDELTFVKRSKRRRSLPPEEIPVLPVGDRWSSWDQPAAGQRGPQPYPDWLVTELAAVDTELGIVKTGKEADVFLLSRAVPDTDRSCLLAAKRYRDSAHRMFHRDSAYTQGRRVRRSRDTRAMANRTAVGREMLAGQWANAEFSALCQLWEAGLPVPYPVQVLGTELMMEFIGDADGTAATRLVDYGQRGAELATLWDQLVHALSMLARHGLAHGDMSAFNLLVHRGQLVMIDLPQIVDVIANPRGAEFLERDAVNVARWFSARGLAGTDPAPGELPALLLSEARLR
jgi:RIO kinase 1